MKEYLQKNKVLLTILFLIIAGLTYVLFSGKLWSYKSNNAKSEQSSIKHPEARKAQLYPEKAWGDTVKTMFPDITKPSYVSADKAQSFLVDKDPVLVLKRGEDIYVYPVSIMSFHHIVNDEIDKEPVAITYCLLADTAETFSRKLDDAILEFGVLGPLYAGNLIMYDKSSDASFMQLNGQGFTGKHKDRLLTRYQQLSRSTWQEVKNKNNVKVLSPQKDIEFYTDFFNKMKGAEVGLNSVTAKNIPLDVRSDPFTQGIGIIKGNKITFVPLEKKTEFENQMQEADFATQVYWYTWSSIYPSTRIIAK